MLKRRLSHRETADLGCDLTTGEAREVTAIVRRNAALLLLELQLDANFNSMPTTTRAG